MKIAPIAICCDCIHVCCLQDPITFEVAQDSVTLDTPITVYGYDVKVLMDLHTCGEGEFYVCMGYG